MLLRKVHKNTIKARLRRGETWTGYLAPSKVSAYHVNHGWHIGILYGDISTLTELEEVTNEYAYYNCSAELGWDVRYWEKG